MKPRDRVLNLDHRFVQVEKWSKNKDISIIPLGDTTPLRNVRDDIPVEPFFLIHHFFISSFFCAYIVCIVIGPFAGGGGFNFR